MQHSRRDWREYCTSNHLIWILYDLRFCIRMRVDKPRLFLHVFIWNLFLIIQSIAHFSKAHFCSLQNCTNFIKGFVYRRFRHLELGIESRIRNWIFVFIQKLNIFCKMRFREAVFVCDFFPVWMFFIFVNIQNECVECIYPKRNILLLLSKCIYNKQSTKN